MSKYIAFDDLKMCVDILADKMTDSGATAIKQAINIADSLPSIELVRCKDCKHYQAEWCYWRDVEIKADDFCSYGKAKEGEE